MVTLRAVFIRLVVTLGASFVGKAAQAAEASAPVSVVQKVTTSVTFAAGTAVSAKSVSAPGSTTTFFATWTDQYGQTKSLTANTTAALITAAKLDSRMPSLNEQKQQVQLINLRLVVP